MSLMNEMLDAQSEVYGSAFVASEEFYATGIVTGDSDTSLFDDGSDIQLQ